MSLKSFILTDPMASWLMGRICGYRSADLLIRGGVFVPASETVRSDFRQRIRRDALDIRRRYEVFHGGGK